MGLMSDEEFGAWVPGPIPPHGIEISRALIQTMIAELDRVRDVMDDGSSTQCRVADVSQALKDLRDGKRSLLLEAMSK